MDILLRTAGATTLIMGMVAAFYLSHNASAWNSIITWLNSKTTLKFLATYLTNHKNQTIGSLPLAGGMLAGNPGPIGIGSAAMSIFMVFEVFKASTKLWEYYVLAVVATAMFRTRNMKTKIVLIGIAIATVMAGWWGSDFF